MIGRFEWRHYKRELWVRKACRCPPQLRAALPLPSGSLLLPHSLCAQFVEQYLGVLQVGGIEALGEPAIYIGEHRASLFASAALRVQACEASCRAQLQRFCALMSCNFDGCSKAVLGSG